MKQFEFGFTGQNLEHLRKEFNKTLIQFCMDNGLDSSTIGTINYTGNEASMKVTFVANKPQVTVDDLFLKIGKRFRFEGKKQMNTLNRVDSNYFYYVTDRGKPFKAKHEFSNMLIFI